MSDCKTLTQKVRIYCTVSEKSEPLSIIGRYKILNILAFGMGTRYPKHEETMTISADNFDELHETKKQLKEDFEKLYSDCDVVRELEN